MNNSKYLLAGASCMALLASCGEAPKAKPNVVLILVDDQGYGDIGAHGNPNINTPNIDKLYAESSRFTQYHVCPTSAPTRASLMTGHHNNRTGVWWTVNGRSLLLERETTMAEIFKDNGYKTGIFGKWHLGDNFPFRPEDRGFDEVLTNGGGGIGQTMDYWDNDYFDDMLIHNGKLERYEGYSNDIWFENAKNFIEENKNEPFFCYLPTNIAHSPYWVEDKYSDQYRDNENVVLPEFYGMLSSVDENIGKLIDYLKSSDLMDNTIFIFTTDNGTAQGAKIEGHRLDGYLVKGYNAGMRGIKASIYEGGHRVPLYIHWKDGGITTGQDINELTAAYDILPTLVEMCDLEVSAENDFDGESLVPLINGDNAKFEDRLLVVDAQWSDTLKPWYKTTAMKREWRLVNETELYNLKTDPEQRENVADKFPEKVAEIKADYAKWWEATKDGHKAIPNFILGDDRQNPTTLYCHDWHAEAFAPWQQQHIRTGMVANGVWWVKIAEDGKYRFRLRRWPVESGLKLNDEAPIRPAIEGTSVKASIKGNSLGIKKARLKIQDKEQSCDVKVDDEYAEILLDLTKGETQLQTWFTIKNNVKIGAYYVEIERVK